MEKCKKHRWRIRDGIFESNEKRRVKVGINIYCEKCGKSDIAYNYSESMWELIRYWIKTGRWKDSLMKKCL